MSPYLAANDVVVCKANRSAEFASSNPNVTPSDDKKLNKHSPAKRILKEIGESTWNQYFKFAFVRNPFDRLVSLYEFFQRVYNNSQDELHKTAGAVRQEIPNRIADGMPLGRPWTFAGMQAFLSTEDFSSFIRSNLLRKEGGAKPQARSLTDHNGRLLVDFVGKFERIDEDWKKICEQIHIVADLPRTNVSPRRFDRLSEYWTKDDVTFAQNIYAVDFELFAYPTTLPP